MNTQISINERNRFTQQIIFIARVRKIDKIYNKFVRRERDEDDETYESIINNMIDGSNNNYHKLKYGFKTLKCKNTVKHCISNHNLIMDYANQIQDEIEKDNFISYYGTRYNYPIFLKGISDIHDGTNLISDFRSLRSIIGN
jgi:hypothetical protein